MIAMKYEVIEKFRDTQDKNHIYEVGKKYPHKGKVNKERAEELAGTSNKYGRAFIKEVDSGGEE